jgi:hypothetical protein
MGGVSRVLEGPIVSMFSETVAVETLKRKYKEYI